MSLQRALPAFRCSGGRPAGRRARRRSCAGRAAVAWGRPAGRRAVRSTAIHLPSRRGHSARSTVGPSTCFTALPRTNTSLPPAAGPAGFTKPMASRSTVGVCGVAERADVGAVPPRPLRSAVVRLSAGGAGPVLPCRRSWAPSRVVSFVGSSRVVSFVGSPVPPHPVRRRRGSVSAPMTAARITPARSGHVGSPWSAAMAAAVSLASRSSGCCRSPPRPAVPRRRGRTPRSRRSPPGHGRPRRGTEHRHESPTGANEARPPEGDGAVGRGVRRWRACPRSPLTCRQIARG